MHQKPIIPHIILSDIGNKNGLLTHSNRKVNRSRISVDTSAYYYTSQTYRKENRNRKENRSVQCGHTGPFTPSVRISLRQRCDDTCDTALIDHNAVTYEWTHF